MRTQLAMMSLCPIRRWMSGLRALGLLRGLASTVGPQLNGKPGGNNAAKPGLLDDGAGVKTTAQKRRARSLSGRDSSSTRLTSELLANFQDRVRTYRESRQLVASKNSSRGFYPLNTKGSQS